MPVVRALRVLKIEDEGQPVPGIVLRPEIALFKRTVGARALTRVVNPSHQIVVIIFFTDTGKVGRKGSAIEGISLTYGVAAHAAARLE